MNSIFHTSRVCVRGSFICLFVCLFVYRIDLMNT